MLQFLNAINQYDNTIGVIAIGVFCSLFLIAYFLSNIFYINMFISLLFIIAKYKLSIKTRNHVQEAGKLPKNEETTAVVLSLYRHFKRNVW